MVVSGRRCTLLKSTPSALAVVDTRSPSGPSGSIDTHAALFIGPSSCASATATLSSEPPTACTWMETPAASGDDAVASEGAGLYVSNASPKVNSAQPDLFFASKRYAVPNDYLRSPRLGGQNCPGTRH